MVGAMKDYLRAAAWRSQEKMNAHDRASDLRLDPEVSLNDGRLAFNNSTRARNLPRA
jgi:hypothetical protein